jgi:CRISPR system Cascade subunit CasD
MAGGAVAGVTTKDNTLLLQLEGPLQAWGERARWSVRDSAREPTKSGVIGLLACALGMRADDELRQLSEQLSMGVRCDRPGVRLTDYHTVVGGVMSAEGKVKTNATTHKPETVVSWRDYLCDASFLVAVRCGDPAVIARLAAAVQNPHWPVYLGRKCCPPSRPVFEATEEYPSLEAALAAWQPAGTATRAVIECEPGMGQRRRNAVVSRARRTFGPLYTRECTLPPGTQHEEGPCTSPD